MINYSTKSLINLANSDGKKTKYRILTMPTHERYETQLCKTGHEFFALNIDGHKKWNTEQCPLPPNYHILPPNELASYLDYDFLLSQSKFGQFQILSQVNQSLGGLPVISLEHTLPLYGVQNDDQIIAMQQMIGNVNVFISEFSQRSWNIGVDSHVIHHGIDTASFCSKNLERKNYILSVANDFIKRDYCLNFSGWNRVTSNLERKVVGDTEGLSEPARSTEELINEYNSCAVFFNSSTLSPIPTSLLEAMSCGCAVVSTSTCMIPHIIQNGVNGFISNDEGELRQHLIELLANEDLRQKVGNKARETIIDLFSEDKFVNNWNKLFEETYEVFYT
jgi:glycosyltransferase involved in cell wall biosynthesis